MRNKQISASETWLLLFRLLGLAYEQGCFLHVTEPGRQLREVLDSTYASTDDYAKEISRANRLGSGNSSCRCRRSFSELGAKGDGECSRERGRDSIADHPSAFFPVSQKNELVRKSLKPCSFAQRHRPVLHRVSEATARKAIEASSNRAGRQVPGKAPVSIQVPVSRLMAPELQMLGQVEP
jgi:hypothetical protein